MTIKTLASRGVPNRAIARQLEVTEGTVRYHRRRLAEQAVDGRSRQPHRAQPLHEAIALWIGRHGARNLAALHEWLLSEHSYAGSLRSIQRYVATHWPPPPKRARRRVKTPPGAEAQAVRVKVVVARIMTNAELVAVGEERILVPTVYRANYLGALKALSQAQNPEPIVRVLDFTQRWVAAMPWADLQSTRVALEDNRAFMDAIEAENAGVRLRLP